MEDLTFKHNGEIVAVVKPTGYVRWASNNVVIPEELQAAVRLASQQQRERPEKISDWVDMAYLVLNQKVVELTSRSTRRQIRLNRASARYGKLSRGGERRARYY